MATSLPRSLLDAARQNKIVGGSEAHLGEFPHHVALRYNDAFLCGGAIISTFLILTAAHCLASVTPRHLKVIAGLHDRTRIRSPGKHSQIRSAKYIYIHEDYEGVVDSNDIAMIVLDSPLQYTSHVRNISLPRQNEDFRGWATVSGWGQTQEDGQVSEELRKVKVPIASTKSCRRKYAREGYEVSDIMFCVGKTGKDSCWGDSGGAAICSRDNKQSSPSVLCGIVSYGHGCGRPGFPGVYTRVASYIDWIESIKKHIIARGKCRTDQFFCFSNSSCVSRSWACDEEEDCKEGEDERDCVSMTTCVSGEFRCSNGDCIEWGWLCDDMDDCDDGSDEDKCPRKSNRCVRGQHQCGVGGRCIPEEWKCDGWHDCDDKSDEDGCASPNSTAIAMQPPCSTEQFHCPMEAYPRCIPVSWSCDGDWDCRWGMDEIGCDDRTNSTATMTTIMSNATTSGTSEATTGPVLDNSTTAKVPDMTTQRELDDPTVPPFVVSSNPCTGEQFYCVEEHWCIPIQRRCDGHKHCRSGFDELGCDITVSYSPPVVFTTIIVAIPCVLLLLIIFAIHKAIY